MKKVEGDKNELDEGSDKDEVDEEETTEDEKGEDELDDYSSELSFFGAMHGNFVWFFDAPSKIYVVLLAFWWVSMSAS